MQTVIYCEPDCLQDSEVQAGIQYLQSHIYSQGIGHSQGISHPSALCTTLRALEQRLAAKHSECLTVLYLTYLSDVHQALIARCLALCPMPVVVVAQTFDGAALSELLSCGRVTFIPSSLSAERINSVLQLAQLRFAVATVNLAKTSQLQETIDGIEVIKQAKGLLQAQGISEGEAHACLQRQAMAHQLPMAVVAKRYVAVTLGTK